MHSRLCPRPLATALSLLMCWCPTVWAQSWVDITANLPVAPKVGTGQSLASDGSALYALATPNGIQRSTDNGNTWSTFHTVSGDAYDLTQIGSRSIDAIGTTLWAGGEPGSLAITQGVLPLHKTSAPAAWTASFSGATPPPVIDVVAYDSFTNTHWAAGRLAGIFKSTDGGSTWTPANGNLPSNNCTSIVARNGKVVAAIPGSGFGGAYTSTDGGVTWKNNGVPLEAIGFLTAVGDNLAVRGNGSNDSRYFSRDFGLTWLATTEDTAAGLRNLINTCADSTTMFAGGTELSFSPMFVPTYTPKVAFSLNGGVTWDDLTAPGLPLGAGKDVVRLCRHGDFLFALTGENRLYRLDLAAVTLTPTLKIAVQPKTDKKLTGGTLTMEVHAGGPSTLTYQWKRDGIDIPGQTTDTLSISNAQPSATGNYTCVVTAGVNSVTSSPARGTVVDRVEGRYDPTYDRTNMAGGDTGTPFLQSDGSLIVLTAGGVYKLGPNGGKVDARAIGGTTGYNGRLVDSAGRILLGGIQGNSSTHRVRRLLGTAGFPDDTSFPQLSANNVIRGITELPGSGYLVWGDFSTMGPAGGTQVAVPRLVLVNYDGSLSSTFNTNITPVLGGVSAVPYVAADNTVWIGVNAGFKKIDSTGQPVAGFTSYQPLASTDFVSSAYLLKSGKMLVTLTNSGSSRPFRLIHSDGTFDSTFNTANLVLNNVFTAAAEQADGKIIVAGNFTTFGANDCLGRYMRIGADGVFDSSFYNATGFGAAGCSGLVYDPRGYLFMANSANNATSGGFQDSSTIGDTIGRNFVRVFATAAPTTDPFADFLANASVPANLRGANEDPDFDGLDNLLEYALDLNPNGSGGGSFTGTLPAASSTPTLLQLTYRRVRKDVTYTVETSPDLQAGTWTATGVTQGTPAGDGTTTASIPIGSGAGFLRLAVTRNP